MVTQISKRAGRVMRDVSAGFSPDFFRALSDPNRIALIAWLAWQREPKTVTEIATSGCCPVDLSVVSRHLRTLLQSGVVEAERRGREVRYRLRVSTLVASLRRAADLLETCCAPPTEHAKPKPKD
jgi:DNA-binding transcriptional ArsR family regulator